MKTFKLFILLSLLGNFATAGYYEENENCIIIYLKNEQKQANLIIACDGNMILSHSLRTEKELENPTEFKNSLYEAFQTMVNESRQKKCTVLDTNEIWLTSCLKQI